MSEPEFVAGCRMPTFRSITLSDQESRIAAEEGSHQLLDALLAYYKKHHWSAAA